MFRLIVFVFVFLNLTLLAIIGYIQFPNPLMDVFFAAICAMITTTALMAVFQQVTLKK